MTDKRILIIDDEKGICRFLNEVLTSHNFATRTEFTGREGLQAVIDYRPHLVILDLGLPDIDGFEVLMKLRLWYKSPIIVVSAKDTPADKVFALNSGADDYLTKPFNIQEMIARIKVAFRHIDTINGNSVFVHKTLSVDLEHPSVTVNGLSISLTSTEFEILKVLIKHYGKVVTYETLLREVWGPNASHHTQYVRVYVGHIRKKLRVSSETPEFIMTEAGIGYRLI